MKVEANKKMVSLHISAYKNIISDLRDEIEQLKVQLTKDFNQKSFAPTKTQQASEFKKHYQEEAARIMEEEDRLHKKEECKCDSRSRDDIEKENIQ
jgi:predicted RNase H-like nuclease (RuvC/YqgF family)